MFFLNINYLVVFIAAIISVGLGFLWYSPIMFSKLWIKEIGYGAEKMAEMKKKNDRRKMSRDYGLTGAASLITALVVAALLNSLVITSFGGLIWLAVLLWLALSMPVSLYASLYGKDSWIMSAINSGYYLVSLVVMTLIIGIFG